MYVKLFGPSYTIATNQDFRKKVVNIYTFIRTVTTVFRFKNNKLKKYIALSIDGLPFKGPTSFYVLSVKLYYSNYFKTIMLTGPLLHDWVHLFK